MAQKKHNQNKLLLAEFKNGNQKAFRKLFELYWERMLFNANVIVVNEDVAKDIVQNIWVGLWEKRENLEIKNFQAYVFKAVRYGCYNYLRDNKFNAAQLEIIESLQLTAEPTLKNQYDLEKTQINIEKALSELSPRCRQIFQLSRIDNTNNEDIAQRLGISKRSVENQVSIALNYIRQHLMLTRFSITILYIFFL